MKIQTFFLSISTVFIILASWASHANDSNDDRLSGRSITVNLKGTADGYDRYVPDIDGDGRKDLARCFDVDLFEVPSGIKIGKATDCLSNIEADENGAIKLVGTTFFRFSPDTLVTRGLTTVQPVTHGSPEITHITGAIPIQDSNDVVRGTGQFAGAQGSVRLSGAVRMTPDGPAGPIFFNCLFVIHLDS